MRYPLVVTFVAIAFVTAGLVGCVAAPNRVVSTATPSMIDALFTVQGTNSDSLVRVVTRSEHCPDVVWSGDQRQRMSVRAEPALLPLRGDSSQRDSKPAHFDVLTCEAVWPTGVASAMVENRSVPAPRKEIRRIVLIADTGCRMKASEDAFQDCNSNTRWPFAEVARQAATFKPDLVVHIGDIHYRESPCPVSNAGCAGSPWGYGADTWRADLFEPAAPLLAVAPWLFVRGNHESCARAGQGWFRFVDSKPFTNARSCNSPAQDADADFSTPFTVPLDSSAGTQLIVFDSSKSSGKAYATTDAAYIRYATQMRQVATLTEQAQHSFFLSHHPLFAFAPVNSVGATQPGGSRGLQSAFASVYPTRLFPDNVSVVMHGHIHLFEAMSFASDHPASMIFGNAGSATEGHAPISMAPNSEAYPGARIDDYASSSTFGFAVMDRVDAPDAASWRVTEYDVSGRAQIVCEVRGTKSRCVPAS